jgi:hypothetical protein
MIRKSTKHEVLTGLEQAGIILFFVSPSSPTEGLKISIFPGTTRAFCFQLTSGRMSEKLLTPAGQSARKMIVCSLMFRFWLLQVQ